MNRKHLGQVAEALAVEYLTTQGYEIIDRNWRCRQGEVDIIVRSGSTLVFVEVRSASTAFLAGADASVTLTKQRRVCMAADLWLSRNESAQKDVQFDVIAVSHGKDNPPSLQHYEDAFTSPWAI